MNKGKARISCRSISGGVINAPTISNIKSAYFLIFLKVIAFIIPKLVKNIETIGISKISAKGMITLNINLKYLSTVNNSLNIPSFNDNKNEIGRASCREREKIWEVMGEWNNKD